MKLKSDIRIKVDKKYHQIYKDLTQNNLGKQVFGSHGRVFLLCSILGFEYDKNPDLNSPDPLFWSRSLNNYDTEHPITILYSIALLNNDKIDYDILSEDKKAIETVEKYANGGMEVLINQVLKPYVKNNDDGFYLDYSNSTFLEEKVLSFINEEVESVPF